MLFDARDIPARTRLDCDVAVVGGGTAGIAIASEFLGSSLEVLLLESGGFREEQATQDLYSGEVANPAHHGPLDKYRQRVIGGTSTLWGGCCAPFDPLDFEARPHVPFSGWPIGRGDLDPYYARAHRYCHTGQYSYTAAESLPTADAPMIPGLDSKVLSQDQLWRFSLPTNFAQRFLRDLRSAPNIRVGLHANCTAIALAEYGTHVRELQVASLAGNRFSVRARYVILAMGGLETARLLLASRDVQRDGVGNAHDLVGRFYCSHITGQLGEAVFTPRGGPVIWDYERSHDGVYCRRILRIDAATQRREGLQNFCCNLTHAPIADPSHGNGVLSAAYLVKRFMIDRIPPEYSKDLAGHMTPYRRVWPHLLNVVRGAPAMLPFSARWLTRRVLARRKLPSVSLANRANVYSLHFDAEQAPNPDSRVTLVRDRDALGMPRLRVDWRHTSRDVDSVADCFRIVRRELAAAGVATFRVDEANFTERIREQLGVGSHHIGTTRMAAQASRGVVDAHCRVHGIDNLFIASSSVFATASFANPTLTIVALAIRVADRVKTLAGAAGGRQAVQAADAAAEDWKVA